MKILKRKDSTKIGIKNRNPSKIRIKSIRNLISDIHINANNNNNGINGKDLKEFQNLMIKETSRCEPRFSICSSNTAFNDGCKMAIPFHNCPACTQLNKSCSDKSKKFKRHSVYNSSILVNSTNELKNKQNDFCGNTNKTNNNEIFNGNEYHKFKITNNGREVANRRNKRFSRKSIFSSRFSSIFSNTTNRASFNSNKGKLISEKMIQKGTNVYENKRILEHVAKLTKNKIVNELK